MVLALMLLLGPVTFSLEAPDAKEVRWAGDVTGWSSPRSMARNGDTWSITFELDNDARTEYKFIVDGKWVLDPENSKSISNGVGGENSVWEGPDYKRTPCSGAAKDVFLGGASLGGVVALRTAAAYPKAVAGGIHAQSGAFWVEGSAPKWPVKALAPGLRVFCDWGSFEGEIAEATQSLVGALKTQGIKVHTWESHEGHNWSAWRERLSFGLVSLFGTNK